ncbi:hypothetical protein B834_2602 [Enterococcus mundtii 1A]|nr:hypothetical protein [Enterococcus mundtii 1A]
MAIVASSSYLQRDDSDFLIGACQKNECNEKDIPCFFYW